MFGKILNVYLLQIHENHEILQVLEQISYKNKLLSWKNETVYRKWCKNRKKYLELIFLKMLQNCFK